MSKFLRFIVNLCMICLLLSGVALIVPQFAGISTTIIGNDITDTNLNSGSVVYAKKVKLDELNKGDSLLRSSGSSIYISEITKADPGTGNYTLRNGKNKSEKITLRDNGEKVLLTVPAIGYLAIAIQTFEGRIILALMIAFLVILFILSEIWKNNDEDDQENDESESVQKDDTEKETQNDDEPDENAAAPSQDDGIDNITEDEINPDDTEETSDVEKEIQELILEPVDDLEEKSSISETDDDFTVAIQAALEKEADAGRKADGGDEDMQQEPEQKLETESKQESKPGQETELPESESISKSENEDEDDDDEQTPAEHKILAIPSMTAEEILQKAHEDGDDPKIIRDEEEGITLIDYSDVL